LFEINTSERRRDRVLTRLPWLTAPVILAVQSRLIRGSVVQATAVVRFNKADISSIGSKLLARHNALLLPNSSIHKMSVIRERAFLRSMIWSLQASPPFRQFLQDHIYPDVAFRVFSRGARPVNSTFGMKISQNPSNIHRHGTRRGPQ
jgi:hypothetical protein